MKKFFIRVYQRVFKFFMNFMPWREPEITEGEGASLKAADILKELDISGALIVTDRHISAINLYAPMLKALDENGIKYIIYDKTVPNPTIDNIEEAYAICRENAFKAIIGFGGGSSIDCAKAVAARIKKPKKSVMKMKGLLKVGKLKTVLIAVPTTSGTGSEATVAAVVVNSETKHKYAINDLSLIPPYAVLDPLLTADLPKNLTSTTGMDALCHAVESFIGFGGTKKTNEFALKAVNLIFNNLYKAYENGRDMEARKNMQKASYLAGAAFTRAYVGNIHAVAHTLGGMYSTPHGLANAVIMPHVLTYYGKSVYKPLAKLYAAANLKGAKSDEEKAAAFIEEIRKLNRKMNIPDNIAELKESDISYMIPFALKEANPLYPVPVIFGYKDFENIYRQLIV